MEDRGPGIYFSTLTGIVMLIFMLASLTDRELFRYDLELFGFSLGFGIGAMELLIPLAAVVTDLGMYLTLQKYLPDPGNRIGLHLFLPFAVTLTIGFTLRSFGNGVSGWVLLLITAVLLYLVLRFEFISCDPASSLRPLSIIILDSLCYAIFLLFVIALRANVSRLAIVLPAVFVICFVVSLKIYSFHIIGSSVPLAAAVSGIVMVFASIGLHYMPVNIVSYGSLMFFWYYTFTNFVIGADRDEPGRQVIRRILPADGLSVIVLIYSVIRL